MKFLKRLDPLRACWLHMQAPDTTHAQLLQQELDFRAQYKGDFVGRDGAVFYFQFKNPGSRALFLNTLKMVYDAQRVASVLINAAP